MIKTLLFGLLTGFTSKYSLDHKIFPLFLFYEYFDTSPLPRNAATVQSDWKRGCCFQGAIRSRYPAPFFWTSSLPLLAQRLIKSYLRCKYLTKKKKNLLLVSDMSHSAKLFGQQQIAFFLCWAILTLNWLSRLLSWHVSRLLTCSESCISFITPAL